MRPDPFDPAGIGQRVTSTKLAEMTHTPSRGSLPRPKKGEQYLGGPIPLAWLSRAAQLSGKAFHLAVALWYAAVRSKGKNASVTLTAPLANKFGLKARTTRTRAILALQQSGLVRVENRLGRSPIITILPALESDCEEAE